MHALLCQDLMKWNNGTLNGLASLAITQNSTSHFPPLPSNKESNKQVQHEKASHWECQQSFLLVPISSVHYHPSEWKPACPILGILLFKLESMLVLKYFVCDELSRKCSKKRKGNYCFSSSAHVDWSHFKGIWVKYSVEINQPLIEKNKIRNSLNLLERSIFFISKCILYVLRNLRPCLH